jgi:hypothetical protein
VQFLGLIKVLLRLVGHLSEWAMRRQLIKAGESAAVNKGLVDVANTIEKARRARSDIDSKRLRSKYRRSSKEGD